MKKLLLALALAGAAAAPAHAVTVMTENFDAVTSGYYGAGGVIGNLQVVSGSIDLLAQNDYGLSCVGGTGKCIDTDGAYTSGTRIESLASFSVNAGDILTLSLDLSGNQRSGSDTVYGGFVFNGADVGLTNVTLAAADPFATYTSTYTAPTAGTVRALFGTSSNDAQSLLADNVVLDVSAPGITSAVPEPSTWAMMLFGFGAISFVMRRRKAPAARGKLHFA